MIILVFIIYFTFEGRGDFSVFQIHATLWCFNTIMVIDYSYLNSNTVDGM